MEKENVCRTCLQIFKGGSSIHLNAAEDDSDCISLRQKLQACVPELTVDIVHEPVICETCYAAVILAYQFKSSCLENEKTLYNFIRQRKQNSYGLLTTSDLLNIARKDINEEHSYSFVEKYSSNGNASDSESDTEPSQIKLPTTMQSSLEGLVKQDLSDIIINTKETSEATDKPKVKNKQIKEDVENGKDADEVTKSVKYLCSTVQPVSTSLEGSEHKQAVNINSSLSNKQAFLHVALENPKLSKVDENAIQVNKNSSKRKLENASKSPKTTETNKKAVKINKQLNVDKMNDKMIPQTKIFKKENDSDSKTILKETLTQTSSSPEKQYDTKINGNEIVPFSNIFIKQGRSSRDIHNTSDDTIDNDLVKINQVIPKIDLTEPEKVSSYKREKRYCCTKCNKTYCFKSHFDIHLKSHILQKLYSCPICEKDFSQEKYLYAHARLHTTNSGLYQCDICLKFLSAATALKRHYRTHTGEKPFVCSCCGKSFTQKVQLSVHMRTHTGSKPFTCNVCKAGFAQKSHLMGHMRIHTGEKPYGCDQCPKRFRKSYALQIHKHSHSVKPYQCKACQFLFKDPNTFQRHINKHLIAISKADNSPVLKKPKSKTKILDELEQDIKDIKMAVSLMEQIDNGGSQKESKFKKFLYHCDLCTQGFTTKFSMKRHMNVHKKNEAKPLM